MTREHNAINKRAALDIRSWVGNLAAGLLLLAVALGGCSKDKDATGQTKAETVVDDRPNIVLITVESLRPDHLGCYGFQRPTSPAIDKLAEQAVVFDNAYSVTSWTLTSHASLFTGLYPPAHQVIHPKDRLNDSHTTIAEVLSEEGYQTAGIISGPLLKKKHNLSQGFEYYDEEPLSPPDIDAIDDITNPDMEKRLDHWLDNVRSDDEPFFLFLYYWDPHYQYIPPEPYDEMFVPEGAKPHKRPSFNRGFSLGLHISMPQLQWVVSQYDGEIRCTDAYLGRFFDRLRELGLWDDTTIILTSDHGEQFFEHGGLGHKYAVYEEEVHVPLLIKLPGQQEGRRDERMASLLDVLPTTLELAEAPVPATRQGISLLDDPRDYEDPLFYDLFSIWYMHRKSTGKSWKDEERWLAVRKGDYKLIWKKLTDKSFELYNLVTDPGEQNPITDPENPVLKELKTRLETWFEHMEALGEQGGETSDAPLTPEEEERLRSIGYIF